MLNSFIDLKHLPILCFLCTYRIICIQEFLIYSFSFLIYSFPVLNRPHRLQALLPPGVRNVIFISTVFSRSCHFGPKFIPQLQIFHLGLSTRIRGALHFPPSRICLPQMFLTYSLAPSKLWTHQAPVTLASPSLLSCNAFLARILCFQSPYLSFLQRSQGRGYYR